MQRERERGISLHIDAFVVHVWWCLPLLRNLSVQKVIECALENPPSQPKQQQNNRTIWKLCLMWSRG